MAIRNAAFELTTGAEMSCSTVPSGVSGGGAVMVNYTQPVWSAAATTNRVTTVGYASGTLAAGASVNIDLTALTGLDGSTVTLATLVTFYAQVTSTTGLLTIGNAATNGHALDFGAVTDTRTLRPGASGSRGPGHAVGDPSGTGWVVDATHKIVKLLNSHGSQAVDYVVMAGGL